MLCYKYAKIRTYYVGVIALIDGYWTALISVMLLILLMTGWSGALHRQLNLTVLLPSILLIWLSASLEWNFQLELGLANLSINASFVLISLLLCLYWMVSSPRLNSKLVLLYSIVLCLGLSTVRAVMMIAPWVEASVSYWYLPLISGILLGFLQLSIAELALIIYCGSSLAELLLMWQQRGEYNGAVASLVWWDFFVIAVVSVVLIKLLLAMLHKGTHFFVQLLGNRMKS